MWSEIEGGFKWRNSFYNYIENKIIVSLLCGLKIQGSFKNEGVLNHRTHCTDRPIISSCSKSNNITQLYLVGTRRVIKGCVKHWSKRRNPGQDSYHRHSIHAAGRTADVTIFDRYYER